MAKNNKTTNKDVESTLEIAKILTLSTAHIRPETAERLDNGLKGLIPVYKYEYGWIIFSTAATYHEEDYATLPEDLKACVSLAVKHGCDWLRLDCDGERYEGLLPLYEW